MSHGQRENVIKIIIIINTVDFIILIIVVIFGMHKLLQHNDVYRPLTYIM